MGRFTGKIVAEYNPPTKWILEKDLGYTADLSEEESKTLEQVGVKIKMIKLSCILPNNKMKLICKLINLNL